MKASDIRPGTAYLASPTGTGRHSYYGKATVIGEGRASDRPNGLHSHRSGHRFWEVEWAKEWDGRGRIPVGERTIRPGEATKLPPVLDEHYASEAYRA